MKAVLSIDQSTSATKALLVDPSGAVLARAGRDHRQHYPQPGWVEHDAEEIWANVLATVRELQQSGACSGIEISAISIANQRETVVIFDRVTGAPVHPAMVWQCRRGDELCAEQLRRGRDSTVRARTGLRIDGYFSASKLQWLVQERPDIARRLQNAEVLIGTMETYLIYRMTRGQVFATDPSNASRTLLFDIHQRAWDEDLCSWWQVPSCALAEVRDCDAQFGESTLDGLLPYAVPIRGVMGDSQAAMFAQGCFEPGSAKATFGSGTSVLVNVGSSPARSTRGAVASLAWVQGGRVTYALEGIINFSAATMNWLRDQLGLFVTLEEAERLAQAAGERNEVYLVPAFAGLGAPYWRDAARAAIVGLSAHSHRGHIVRAALEAIAFQLRDVIEMLQAEAGVAVSELRCDGGATRSDPLMQFTADVLGIELRLPRHPECSAIGAAMMGMLGIGWYPSPQAMRELTSEAHAYRRKMSPDEADCRYRGWQRAVQQVLGVT
ncbi:FGGY family carbohydrate kinase [Steroidobacter agaridevorans]|uniref:FGGY family carbohydrate kinase n=1 Tax=Steroidobacter agaridevorans TaxID=2695856 RepID=UPI0013289FAA|nr:glycerol kinase GlpK [Steroidobacter agaridevorans]GFE87747.1 glycerol kinase [Steroidobacter agaridevorans]